MSERDARSLMGPRASGPGGADMSTHDSNARRISRILITGATGYVGGRLLTALERSGRRVRCLARRPEFLKQRVSEGTEVARGDLLEPESLESAREGVAVAYYLAHSMGEAHGFAELECRGARNFAAAAQAAGVKRIIYLGGLGGERDLSEHLQSRHEVGRILRESGIPTIELRASIVIGSGSLSFELVRALVERLPVMVTPRWLRMQAQPIAIEDVIAYLLEALEIEAPESAIYEIGGPDRVTYEDLMCEYARHRGLRRWIFRVPLLTPRLSSLWLGLVSPVYARVGRKLIDSTRNETVLRSQRALEVFSVRPRGVREAIERALANEDLSFAETRWSDAISSSGARRRRGGVRLGSRIVDSRAALVAGSPERVFKPVRQIGGRYGWHYGDWLWAIRAALDLLLGGPGMRRGRPEGRELRPGDALDFWRVESFEPDRLLRLQAEMKLPGRAWLQFEVEPREQGSMLTQTVIFEPIGVLGLAYWYGLYPIHALMFGGMLRSMARKTSTA